jgi:ribonucleoside-diphosphate reductase alpha chain
MKRVQEDSYWTLMSNECPGLYDVHGEKLKKCTPIMKKAGKVEKPSKRMNCGRKS